MPNFPPIRTRRRSQARSSFARDKMTRTCLGIRSRGARLALALLLASACTVRPASAGVSEDELKAAFLYKVLGFVSWPSEMLSSGTGPLRVCFLEKHPFARLFASRVEGKRVAGHTVSVDWLTDRASPQSCHAVFIRTSESSGVGKLLDQIGGAPVLTIGDGKNFAARGGIIGFRRISNKFRLEVNLRAAQRANLVISAQFLEIAIVLTDRLK